MGEDSLSQFHNWKHFEKILAEADLLVARRPNSDHSNVDELILKYTIFVDHKPVEISSSDIKRRISDLDYINDNLSSGVISIIEKENLYR
jgi:nicotinate-nucleotide adenylyltransferase